MSMLIAVPLLLLVACQAKQQEPAPETSGEPTAIIPEYPIWVNTSCASRTIRLMTANIQPENLLIRLGNTAVEAERIPNPQGESGHPIYWTLEIPSDEGYDNLSIVHQTEEGEVPLAASSILYLLPGEKVRLFNHYTTLQPPTSRGKPVCWPDYEGPAIPGGESFTLSYDKAQTDRVFMSDIRRTIGLSNVVLKEKQSGQVYRIEAPLNYTSTVPDAIALMGRVEGLAGIDLGDKGRVTTSAQVDKLTIQSQADATPSYRVVEVEYGSQTLLRIKDCETADTLSREPFIMPDRLQVELNCQPK